MGIVSSLGKQITMGVGNIQREKFSPIVNKRHTYNKPMGGLWSSTYTPKGEFLSDWIRFCKGRIDYAIYKNAVLFDIKEGTKIYQINSQKDLIELFDLCGSFNDEVFDKGYMLSRQLDFENLSKKFDVLNLSKVGKWRTRLPMEHIEYNLEGWDVESSLILNFDCIENIEYIKIEV